jgi:hypothetical protein
MFPRKPGWFLLLVAALLTVTAVPGFAQKVCSQQNIKGTYATIEQGTVLPTNNSFPVAPVPYPVVITGHVTFDGAGSVSGTYNGNFGGQAVVAGMLEGTYEFTADCAFSITFTSGGGSTHHLAGFITGEGTLGGAYFVYTDPGVVVSGTAKKQ